MNDQEDFDVPNAQNQYGYQEIHPEFKTDYSDIKMNRSGYPDFKDLPWWHKILVVIMIILSIPLGVMCFFALLAFFSSGAIFYIIPYFVLACLGIRILAAMCFPKQ